MEQTIQALGAIALKAIPTIVLLVFLHFYLKFMLFAPLRKVLKERDDLTAGAQRAAKESLASADRKAAEFETKLQQARAEAYKQQEETRKQWMEDQARQVAEAHARTQATVKQARFEIATEAASARQSLLDTAGALADGIATAILGRGSK